jgi:hypothetical protein
MHRIVSGVAAFLPELPVAADFGCRSGHVAIAAQTTTGAANGG